jgi:transposase-like protein
LELVAQHDDLDVFRASRTDRETGETSEESVEETKHKEQDGGHFAWSAATRAFPIPTGLDQLLFGDVLPARAGCSLRIDQAMYAVVMEAYVHGVSTQAASTAQNAWAQSMNELISTRAS